MPFGDYEQLQHAISDWLDRDDLGDKIPDFIRLAEIRVQQELQFPTQDKIGSPLAMTSGVGSVALPVDLLELDNFVILTDPRRQLEIVSADKIRDVRENGPPGIPLAGRLLGFTIELAPTPDTAHPYELYYKTGLPALTKAEPTNLLLTQHPNTLLYGAIVEAKLYLEDVEGANTWSIPYERALQASKRQIWRLRTGGGPLRIRPDSFA